MSKYREEYNRALLLRGSARYAALYKLGSTVQSKCWDLSKHFERGAVGNLAHNFNGSMSAAKHFVGMIERSEPIYGYKTKKLRTPEELEPVIEGWDKTIVQNLLSMIELIESLESHIDIACAS